MATTQFDLELLLLEIEELFERFRTLSQDSRAMILAKLKIKLLEEFKDFIIQESDINQETVIEISYRTIVDDNTPKDVNIIDLPEEFTQDIENYCESTTIDNPAPDFFPSIETVPVEPEKVTVHSAEQPQQNDVIIVTPTEPHLLQQNDVVIVTPMESQLSQQNDIVIVTPSGPLLPQQNNLSTVQKVVKEPKTKTCLICNYCGKQYEKKKLFKTHLRRHENNRKYECAGCSLRFNVKDDLIKHLKTHSSKKNFKCSICSKLFVNNVWLKNHIKVIHEKSEKYFCQKCNYFSFSNRTLKEHVRLKHDNSFRKYACLVCKNVFKSKVELKIHLRSHTGEKPYQCSLCTAAFIRSGHLTNHMNNVHGEKKFPCEICEKSFKTSDKLKRHFLIHTRIKPFSCPFCNNYASNTPGNLNKHVKVVHQMNDFSYSKYKKMILGQVENVREEWIKNSESVTNEYLENLSTQNQALTIEQLKEQYTQKKKKKAPNEKNTDSLLFDNLPDVNETLN